MCYHELGISVRQRQQQSDDDVSMSAIARVEVLRDSNSTHGLGIYTRQTFTLHDITGLRPSTSHVHVERLAKAERVTTQRA